MSKIEDSGGGYVMPYIDNAYAVEDDGSCFIIDSGGSVRADSTEGISRNARCCECGYDCGEDVLYVDGDSYCYDCASYCEHCGEYHRNQDGSYIDSAGVTVCDWCRDNNYTQCDGCGEYFADSDDIVNHQHGDHCHDCFMDEYTICECCGDSCMNDEVVMAGDYDEPHCPDCVPEDADVEDAEVSFS